MMKTSKKNIPMLVAWILIIVGALNWGLVGVFKFDLVARIFGEMGFLTRIIYTLVGASAVWMLVDMKSGYKGGSCESCHCGQAGCSECNPKGSTTASATPMSSPSAAPASEATTATSSEGTM